MARFGDTLRPELMRADTSGILRGSQQGAAAMGAGIESLGRGVAAGIEQRRESKELVKGTEQMAKALGEFLPEDSKVGNMARELAETLSNPELRLSEAAGLAKAFQPTLNFASNHMAQQFEQEMTRGNQGLQRSEFFRRLNKDTDEREGMQADKDYRDALIEIENRKLDNDAIAAGAAMGPVEKKLNEAVAGDVAAWIGEGRAAYQSTRDKLAAILDEGVIEDVGTGPIAGTLSKIPGVNALSHRKRALEQQIHAVGMESLRATLGAQFTEREMRMLLSTYFDRTLPEHANREKLKQLLIKLDNRARSLDDAAEDLNKYGRLQPDTIEGLSRTGASLRGVKGGHAADSAESAEDQFMRDYMEDAPPDPTTQPGTWVPSPSSAVPLPSAPSTVEPPASLNLPPDPLGPAATSLEYLRDLAQDPRAARSTILPPLR